MCLKSVIIDMRNVDCVRSQGTRDFFKSEKDRHVPKAAPEAHVLSTGSSRRRAGQQETGKVRKTHVT